VLIQIGHLKLESQLLDEADMEGMGLTILNLIYNTFDGNVVLVFNTTGGKERTSKELHKDSSTVVKCQEQIFKTPSSAQSSRKRNRWRKRVPKIFLPKRFIRLKSPVRKMKSNYTFDHMKS